MQSECTVSEESLLQMPSTPSGCGVLALHEVEDQLMVCIQVKRLFEKTVLSKTFVSFTVGNSV